jgi:hypothetical protein
LKLSSHFELSEFTVSQTAARLGIDNTPPPYAIEHLKRTAQWLEGVRILLGVPITISSGYRCLELNRAIGSKDTSQHVLGQAADFTAPGFGSPRHVIDRIIDAKMEFDQLILEYPPNGWIHVSVVAGYGRQQALLIDNKGTVPLFA